MPWPGVGAHVRGAGGGRRRGSLADRAKASPLNKESGANLIIAGGLILVYCSPPHPLRRRGGELWRQLRLPRLMIWGLWDSATWRLWGMCCCVMRQGERFILMYGRFEQNPSNKSASGQWIGGEGQMRNWDRQDAYAKLYIVVVVVVNV